MRKLRATNFVESIEIRDFKARFAWWGVYLRRQNALVRNFHLTY